MPSDNSNQSPRGVLDELTSLTDQLTALAGKAVSSIDVMDVRRRVQLRRKLETQVERLDQVVDQIDPVLKPLSVFDPGDPMTSARMIALTMVAQPRHPLAAIRPFYGAGVYALYYCGPFEPYEGLSGKEQPIYVGKADPVSAGRHATDAVKQGVALYKRLSEHAKSIGAASSTLDVADFECRFLIVQSGFQQAAEARLINFFHPIWNSEEKICHGIGKHGDASKTRANKRSPWDTLHPGRAWAKDSAQDQKPRAKIIEDIKAHLEQYPPKSSIAEIMDAFIDDLRQLDPTQFQLASGERQEVDGVEGHNLAPDQTLF